MTHPALRLTPSNSPFFRHTTPRSPTKLGRNEEPGLRLKKVIGTTTATASGFDCLPQQNKFAYVAGATAVVASVDDEGGITQAFFRAGPNLSGSARDSNGQWPTPSASGESRMRARHHHVRDHSSGSPLGASARDVSDSPAGKTLVAMDRVKAATSVALSPNGKWIAVGETGYKPRVLIFPLTDGSSETPVAAFAEHSFGVHILRFSPDSRYLASLGTVNDGYLHVWLVDEWTANASLHASNKCTSLVNSMCWMGRAIVTVGLRFVKVWRVEDDAPLEGRNGDSVYVAMSPRQKLEARTFDFNHSTSSPRHKVLAGKNSLLGSMLGANFVSAIFLSDHETVICAESGEICILDDAEKAQLLTAVGLVDFQITAAALDDSSKLHVAGPGGNRMTLDVTELRTAPLPLSDIEPRRNLIMNPKVHSESIVAVAVMRSTTVEFDSTHGITLKKRSLGGTDDNESTTHTITAHGEAILGVQALTCTAMPNAAFLTYAGNGTVYIWDSQGQLVKRLCVPFSSSAEMYDLANELKCVCLIHRGGNLAAGDKYGTLITLDVQSNSVITQTRAHSSEIVTMATFERSDTMYIVTGGRDRTVQLFASREGRPDLIQTMNEHAGAVTGLLVTPEGDLLLSCSADRTIVVREALLRNKSDLASLIYVSRRTITLRASPTSMCLGLESHEMVVAATDRTIAKYNMKSGQAEYSFKCSDAEGGESALISKVLFAPNLDGSPAIIGVSSSDKSVRLYNESGSLIGRDYGHTEGITDALLLPRQSTDNPGIAGAQLLITVAADSSIFMWDPSPVPSKKIIRPLDSIRLTETTPITRSFAVGPPLRKVISYSDLSRYRRDQSIDEDESASPRQSHTPSLPPSPQRLRRKTSRMSIAQTPKLEPAFRHVTQSSRRISLRQRSPSPPSPRNPKKDVRRQSLRESPRSRSSENISLLNVQTSVSTSRFGSLTASTESLCRTLRVYRRRLMSTAANDTISRESVAELEKELHLTAQALGERSQGSALEEAMMSKFLDQASERIVGMLDERIKERVESEVRNKSGDALTTSAAQVELPAVVRDEEEPGADHNDDAIAGALQRVALDDRPTANG